MAGDEGFRGALDAPADGAALEQGQIRVIGWAQCGASPLARVEVRVDGEPAGLARPCQLRHDVVEALGDARLLWSGFEHVVELRREPGDAQIAVTAHGLDGGTVELSARVRVREPTPPHAQPPPPLPRGRRRRARRTTVLVVAHSLERGGAELCLLELLRQLAGRPDLGFVLVAPRDGSLRPSFEDIGVPVRILGQYPTSSLALYELKVRRIGAVAREHDCDAVLANTLPAFPGIDAARSLGLPSIWSIHEGWGAQLFWETFYAPHELHPAVRRRGEQALRCATATVFVSDYTRGVYERWVRPGSARVIRYGIDFIAIEKARHAQSRADARGRLGLPVDSQVLLTVGPIVPPKGQSLLVEAFRQVAQRRDDAHLLLVGDSPSLYASALRDWIAAQDAGERVHFAGIAADTGSCYRATDWLVVASDVESLPRTIVEALAFGIPVAATSAGGIPELIEDQATGYLCAPRDLGAMVAMLERALTADAGTRQRLAAAGAARARKQHDPAACADAYAAVLADLGRERRLRRRLGARA